LEGREVRNGNLRFFFCKKRSEEICGGQGKHPDAVDPKQCREMNKKTGVPSQKNVQTPAHEKPAQNTL